MSNAEDACEQITSFLNSQTEKTLLLCGIADDEKHCMLLKTLNSRGKSKGFVFLIHTTKEGMEINYSLARLSGVKVPKKYGQAIQLSSLTICFDNLTTKRCSNRYKNCTLCP